mmetsp:Transcript_23156/g.46211  ORF Transcript_23156/g.46211 Transcript_23156/m.46211 type:complete len:237 (+) Transcript_23156:838-1548(+)
MVSGSAMKLRLLSMTGPLVKLCKDSMREILRLPAVLFAGHMHAETTSLTVEVSVVTFSTMELKVAVRTEASISLVGTAGGSAGIIIISWEGIPSALPSCEFEFAPDSPSPASTSAAANTSIDSVFSNKAADPSALHTSTAPFFFFIMRFCIESVAICEHEYTLDLRTVDENVGANTGDIDELIEFAHHIVPLVPEEGAGAAGDRWQDVEIDVADFFGAQHGQIALLIGSRCCRRVQ